MLEDVARPDLRAGEPNVTRSQDAPELLLAALFRVWTETRRLPRGAPETQRHPSWAATSSATPGAAATGVVESGGGVEALGNLANVATTATSGAAPDPKKNHRGRGGVAPPQRYAARLTEAAARLPAQRAAVASACARGAFATPAATASASVAESAASAQACSELGRSARDPFLG